ncbi:hypothetical protein SS50377_27013 [Spironucleus salmonicida]|uniref:Uncharacterized protein n=1 Tax=Spironucleus salmonicida TaxID=348837 RepID=V6LSE7_9EUKA|nr:hypothetical protein SS50377_27013 [Spironucleus salmonicida]|eukprot:EST47525.1 Hypothetical protein SS50377_12509 [Spironucleus salmonicida]
MPKCASKNTTKSADKPSTTKPSKSVDKSETKSTLSPALQKAQETRRANANAKKEQKLKRQETMKRVAATRLAKRADKK